jgi:hypothetical protein
MALKTAGLHQNRPRQERQPRCRRIDPMLLFWRRMIAHAVDEAKKTSDGLPTALAIMARWWIADHQPLESDREEWERSFACACQWLDRDPTQYRKQLVDEIDSALMERFLDDMRAALYLRRAAVLACAGVPTAIARQFVMPLVAAAMYDEVAGLETMDFFPDDVEGFVISPAATATVENKTAVRVRGRHGVG